MSKVISINLYDIENDPSSDEEETTTKPTEPKKKEIIPLSGSVADEVVKIIKQSKTNQELLKYKKYACEKGNLLPQKSPKSMATLQISSVISPKLPSPHKQLGTAVKSPMTSPKSVTTEVVSTPQDEFEIRIKDEVIDFEEGAVVKQVWQELDSSSFVKQEDEIVVPPENLDNENILEGEYEKALDENSSAFDEQYAYCDQENDEDSNYNDEECMTSQDIPENFEENINEETENPPKRAKLSDALQNHAASVVAKKKAMRQVACKSTDTAAMKQRSGFSNELVKIGKRFVKVTDITSKNGQNSILIGNKLIKIVDNSSRIEENSKNLSGISTNKGPRLERIVRPKEPKRTSPKTGSSSVRYISNYATLSSLPLKMNQNLNANQTEAQENSESHESDINFNIKEEPDEDLDADVTNSEEINNDDNVVPSSEISPSSTDDSIPTITTVTLGQTVISKAAKPIQKPPKLVGSLIEDNKNNSSISEPSEKAEDTSNTPDFMNIKIKEEKMDYDDYLQTTETITPFDPSFTVKSETDTFDIKEIKEEQIDDYFSAGPSTSTSNEIISTKVVNLPNSKPRKIIVIKKPLSVGATPGLQQITKAQLEQLEANNMIKKVIHSSPGSKILSPGGSPGQGSIRYIVKSKVPGSGVKIENNPESTIRISNLTSPGTSKATATTVRFPKTNQKIVVDKSTTIYRCQKCDIIYLSHSEYMEHMEMHKNATPLFSEKKILGLEDLKKMNQYQCSQCSAGFLTLEKLSSHENRHKTEFVCKHCDKKFLLLYRYKEHLLQHETKKPKYLECKVCAKKFIKQERLDEHMDTHYPRLLLDCNACDKKFDSQSQLSEHQKMMHFKRPTYKCGLCQYETLVKQNFEKHAGMHMRYMEKINSNQFFKCDQCPQSFREQGVLDMHKNHMHGGN